MLKSAVCTQSEVKFKHKIDFKIKNDENRGNWVNFLKVIVFITKFGDFLLQVFDVSIMKFIYAKELCLLEKGVIPLTTLQIK